MSRISVGIPQMFGPEGPSRRTPHRNRLPTSLVSRFTVAMKQGQPSSARPGVKGVSLQTTENRPDPSQLPTRRALRDSSRFNPVRYRNRTASIAMRSSSIPGWMRVEGPLRGPRLDQLKDASVAEKGEIPYKDNFAAIWAVPRTRKIVVKGSRSLPRSQIDRTLKALKSGQAATGLLIVPSPPVAFLPRPTPTPPRCSPPPVPEGAAPPREVSPRSQGLSHNTLPRNYLRYHRLYRLGFLPLRSGGGRAQEIPGKRIRPRPTPRGQSARGCDTRPRGGAMRWPDA